MSVARSIFHGVARRSECASTAAAGSVYLRQMADIGTRAPPSCARWSQFTTFDADGSPRQGPACHLVHCETEWRVAADAIQPINQAPLGSVRPSQSSRRWFTNAIL